MAGLFLRKYNVTLDATTAGSTKVRISIRKAGTATFATGSDWSPASGDVKISKDGGAEANIGTLPAYSNGQWEFILSGTELSAKSVHVRISNAAVDDEDFTVETSGSASGQYPTDYVDAVRLGMTGLPNAAAGSAGGLVVIGTSNNQFQSTLGVVPASGNWNTTTPPTVAAIRAEIDANSTKLDVVVSTRLAAADYTAPSTPPTVAAIRAEMDANSTKLANLDAAVSSRLAAGSYTAPDNAGIGTAASAAAAAQTAAEAAEGAAEAAQGAAETGATAAAAAQAAAEAAQTAIEAVDVPTVAEIDAQLTASHGDGSWLTGEGGGGGTNNVSVEVTEVRTL